MSTPSPPMNIFLFSVFNQLNRRSNEKHGTCLPRSNVNCRHLGESSNYIPGCCSKSEPCGLGEGGCSNDSHCMSNLECGHNNCGIRGRNDTRCCRTPWNRPGNISREIISYEQFNEDLLLKITLIMLISL